MANSDISRSTAPDSPPLHDSLARVFTTFQPSLAQAVLYGLALVVVVVGLIGDRFGLAGHGDSRAMLENSIPVILRGGYAPSRAYGTPLYEGLTALSYLLTGGYAAMSYLSTLLAVTSLFIFNALIAPAVSPRRRILMLAGFALYPVFLINASTLAEWMPCLTLSLCLIGVARRYLEDGQRRHLVPCFLISVLLMLVRPDAGIVCCSVCIASMWGRWPRTADMIVVAMTYAAALAVTLAVMISINGGMHILTNGFVPDPDSLAHRLGRAAIALFAAFGGIGLALPLLAFADASRSAMSTGNISAIERLFLVTGALLMLRFVVHPDKLEYLMLLPPLALLAAQERRVSDAVIAVCVLFLVLQSVFTISLFRRTPDGSRFTLALGVHRSAILQDWESMRMRGLVMDRNYLVRLAGAISPGHPTGALTAINYEHYLLSAHRQLFIEGDDVYEMRDDPVYLSGRYSVILCDRAMNDFIPGWRVLHPPVEPPLRGVFSNNLNVHCGAGHVAG